jgi:hypothetical protein
MASPCLSSGTWLCGLSLAACAGLGLFWYAASQRDGGPDAESSQPAESTKADALEMDEEQRGFLWEIEHHGNLLNKYGFKVLAGALERADEKALTGLLAPDFRGEVPDKPLEVSIRTEILQAVRLTDAGTPPLAVDREQFVARLLDYRRQFRHQVKAKLSLMKLYPTDPRDLDKPWEGTGQLRLWGEGEPGKPVEVTVYLKYRTLRPSEEGLGKGAWLSSCAVTQGLVARSDRYLMREAAAERGLRPERVHDNWRDNTQHGATGGVYLCDYDRDGILDVLVTDLNGCFLYKGLPDGKFRDVTDEVGLPSVMADRTPRGLVAAFVDLDGDGWEDLILGEWVFRNVQGKRFENATFQSNLRLPPDAIGVAVADFDRDGRMDLYVFRAGGGKAGSWLDGKRGDGKTNQLLRNLGDWQFEDVTRSSGTSGDSRSTFTAVWLDADNDGWPDLYVPNEFGPGVLYVNQKDGTFRERLLGDGPADFGTMGVTCGDVDNDGNIDLYCANMYSKAGTRVIGNMRPGTYSDELTAKFRSFVKGSQLHRNLGGQRFEQKGQAWQVADAGWAYGAALADLDNDGWLDLHATAGYISRSRTEPDG